MTLPFLRPLFQRSVVVLSSVALLSACATASKDLAATYVAPMTYEGYTCEQLTAESQRLQGRYVELGGRLDKAASNDAAIMGVGLILFWPALFALGGTKGQEAEYSRLKGEYEAVQQTVVKKQCGMTAGGSTPAPAAAPAAGTPAAPTSGSGTPAAAS
jgi:hypothetical protein